MVAMDCKESCAAKLKSWPFLDGVVVPWVGHVNTERANDVPEIRLPNMTDKPCLQSQSLQISASTRTEVTVAAQCLGSAYPQSAQKAETENQ